MGKKDLEAARAPMEQSFFERNAEIRERAIARKEKRVQRQNYSQYTQECAARLMIMQTYVQLRNTLITKYTNNKMR